VSDSLIQLCTSCGDPRARFRQRADAKTLRKSCVKCQAAETKAWRQKNWQRRKLRDTWRGMIRRCHEPAHRRWNNAVNHPIPKTRDYADLGIKVCKRWRASFEAFVEDMGPPPTPQHTLDRIRNAGHYSCGRCYSCVTEVLVSRPAVRQKWAAGDRVGPYVLLRSEYRETGSHGLAWIAACPAGHERKIHPAVVDRRAAQGRLRGCAECRSDAVPRTVSTKVHNLVDMTGQRVGMLTVVARAASTATAARWLCRCDCGTEKVVSRTSLLAALRGKPHGTRSCGCAHQGAPGPRGTTRPAGEVERHRVWKNYVHGAERRGLSWGLSKADFFKLTSADCFYCGAAPGNTVKPTRLESDFLFFYNGVDRKDNALGYELDNCVTACSICNHAKHTMSVDDFLAWVRRLASNVALKFGSNCRWADPNLQAANRKNARFVVVNGESLTLSEAARRVGMRRQLLTWRLDHGWPLEKALVPPQHTLEGCPF